MAMLLDLMREAGRSIDFIGDRPAEHPSYADALAARGIPVVIGRGAALAHLTEHGRDYSAVWISRPELAEDYLAMVFALAVKARVIYDTVDLHWVRLARGIPFSESPDELRADAERMRRVELANARSVDLTIAITDDEKRTLLAEAPEVNVVVLPNIHLVSLDVAPLCERRDLFFIGSFHHVPNVDAVMYFAREILPLMHQSRPDICLHVVGSDMPYEIRSLKGPGINPVGYVQDVTPWFNKSRVFIAPLRYGAGMKGKVGQSLGLGLPVVTSSIGAEGMALTHGVDAMIADDPADFAVGVLRLYTDDPLWERVSRAGQTLIKHRFSKEAVRPLLLPIVT
jgi:glycosyltransferase involved in cell wall biosynthesis